MSNAARRAARKMEGNPVDFFREVALDLFMRKRPIADLLPLMMEFNPSREIMFRVVDAIRSDARYGDVKNEEFADWLLRFPNECPVCGVPNGGYKPDEDPQRYCRVWVGCLKRPDPMAPLTFQEELRNSARDEFSRNLYMNEIDGLRDWRLANYLDELEAKVRQLEAKE